MNKNHPVRHTSFFNARLTSTISISLVLFVLGLIALTSILANELSTYVKENIGLSIVLKDTTRDPEIKQLQKELNKAPYVKSARYITKEEALKILINDLGENPEEFLGYNPLQASLEINLKAGYANGDSLGVIEKKLSKYAFIKSVHYPRDFIRTVNENVRRIGLILGGVAVILMLISFALISNTIRLTAYSRRFLIHTMKLVGATPGFIRRPFILSHIANGIIAAFIAIGMLTGCLYYLDGQIESLSAVLELPVLLVVYALILLAGIFLTAISAFFAVNRYIRMNHDHLYYI